MSPVYAETCWLLEQLRDIQPLPGVSVHTIDTQRGSFALSCYHFKAANLEFVSAHVQSLLSPGWLARHYHSEPLSVSKHGQLRGLVPPLELELLWWASDNHRLTSTHNGYHAFALERIRR